MHIVLAVRIKPALTGLEVKHFSNNRFSKIPQDTCFLFVYLFGGKLRQGRSPTTMYCVMLFKNVASGLLNVFFYFAFGII